MRTIGISVFGRSPYIIVMKISRCKDIRPRARGFLDKLWAYVLMRAKAASPIS